MADTGTGGAGGVSGTGTPGAAGPGAGTAGAVVDQAHCRGRAIPAELSKPLQGVSKLLEGRINYNTWSFTVTRTLMAARLEQIIDPSVPRPAAGDPLYNTWEDISLQVGHWLTGQISEALQTQLYTGSAPIDYADEVLEAIRNLLGLLSNFKRR
jgi:hypothetical protein